MKKSELTSGMIVQLRSGVQLFVVSNVSVVNENGKEETIPFILTNPSNESISVSSEVFNDDLTNIDGENGDIVKVFSAANSVSDMWRVSSTIYRPLFWERGRKMLTVKEAVEKLEGKGKVKYAIKC